MENKKIIPGRNPVFEYLSSGSKADMLLVAEGAHGKVIDSILELAKKKGTPVRKTSTAELDRTFDGNHQGVLLYAARKNAGELDLKEVAAEKGTVVLLDQITDPHNVGAIIRSAEALGASSVVMQKANSPSLNETVVKSSAGATAYINITYVTNIARFIDDAKDAGFWVIGATDHGAKPIRELRGTKPALIIIGSEGTGMRRLTEEKCDYLAKIPLKGNINSLNASVAAGIMLYELLS